MALKLFLQNLFERVGLAEAPMPPPREAHVALADPQRLRPIFMRLAAWGVKHLQLAAVDASDVSDLPQAARQAIDLGLEVGIRGRASDLAAGKLLLDLAAAGVREVEIPLLSSVAEVHDALAGMGDYRCALRALDILASLKLRPVVQLVLTPSTWKTIERTLEMLDDRRLHSIRAWAIVCRDDEPSSWALSPGELTQAAKWIEAHARREMAFAWYPPLRFKPSRTLAHQVRHGPRAALDAVRIEADGSIIPPIGAAIAGGKVSQNDWKLIARSEVFRAWKRQREAPRRCEQCPGLAACTGGCLRDEGNWAEA